MSQTTKQTSKAPSSSTSTPSFQITAQARQLPRRPDHGIETISADRKSTRLNSSHSQISYAVFCLKKNNQANDLRLEVSKIDLQTDQLNTHTKFLLMDRNKVWPDLKEVRAKLRPESIPLWLKNPHA